MTTVAPTVREALDLRITIGGDIIEARVPHLGGMLCLQLNPGMIDQPLTPEQLTADRPSPMDPSPAKDGPSATSSPTAPSTTTHHRRPRQGPRRPPAGMVRGRRCRRLLDTTRRPRKRRRCFVDEVIPLLQERGIYPTDYESPGATISESQPSTPSTHVTRAAAGNGLHNHRLQWLPRQWAFYELQPFGSVVEGSTAAYWAAQASCVNCCSYFTRNRKYPGAETAVTMFQ
jgi:hypothetical protein